MSVRLSDPIILSVGCQAPEAARQFVVSRAFPRKASAMEFLMTLEVLIIYLADMSSMVEDNAVGPRVVTRETH